MLFPYSGINFLVRSHTKAPSFKNTKKKEDNVSFESIVSSVQDAHTPYMLIEGGTCLFIAKLQGKSNSVLVIGCIQSKYKFEKKKIILIFILPPCFILQIIPRILGKVYFLCLDSLVVYSRYTCTYINTKINAKAFSFFAQMKHDSTFPDVAYYLIYFPPSRFKISEKYKNKNYVFTIQLLRNQSCVSNML